MELLPTPDPGGAAAPSPPEPGVADRLGAVERRLEELHQRLARVESALGPTVAQEVKGATSELARAITELGRRLALDLPHELRRHRDVIVAELRPPPAPPPPPPPAAPAEVDVDEDDIEPEREAGSGADPGAPPPGRRAPRRRRRLG